MSAFFETKKKEEEEKKIPTKKLSMGFYFIATAPENKEEGDTRKHITLCVVFVFKDIRGIILMVHRNTKETKYIVSEFVTGRFLSGTAKDTQKEAVEKAYKKLKGIPNLIPMLTKLQKKYITLNDRQELKKEWKHKTRTGEQSGAGLF